jgi:hypothetical protein
VPAAGRFVGVGPYVGAGGRAGFDVRTADDTTVRLFVQVEGAIVRTRYDAVGGAIWVTPPFNVIAAVGLDLPGG